jgi:hypothetical protein
MLLRLLAPIFGWKLAYVQYGYSDYVRRIRKTSDGVEYVVIYGTFVDLANPGGRRVVRL